MLVTKSELAVGKCYLRSTGQVRRILKINDVYVTYEGRGRRFVIGTWNPKVKAKIETFLSQIDREVPCDFDADLAP